jgi:hypothetical protein
MREPHLPALIEQGGYSRNNTASDLLLKKLDDLHTAFKERPAPQILDQRANMLSLEQEKQLSVQRKIG